MFKLIKKILRPFLSPKTVLWTHKIRGQLAARLYGYPAKKLTVIGVTGTNGKTTVCHLIASILQAADYKIGMATTIDFQVGDDIRVNKIKMTTVSPFMLQKLLREMVEAGCRYAILETTSHALTQFRVWGIPYSVAVLTNVTHDHLDYHKTFESYRQAKETLFAHNPQVSVVNADDPSAPHFLKYPAESVYTYSLENRADIMARKILYAPASVTFTAITSEGQLPLLLNLPGKFNIYNTLAAIAVGLSQKVPLATIKLALEKIHGIPGRMEPVEAGQNFSVLIDYAHTPDALQNVYETIRRGARNHVIAVLGACGDRDKLKRPILGELAAKYADYVIITNEDPYTEDPQSIIDAVAAGIPKGRQAKTRYKHNTPFKIFKVKGTGENEWWWKIMERREAIKKAFTLAEKGDVVIITGKGAEEAIVVGDKHLPWSDRKVSQEILEAMRFPQT